MVLWAIDRKMIRSVHLRQKQKNKIPNRRKCQPNAVLKSFIVILVIVYMGFDNLFFHAGKRLLVAFQCLFMFFDLILVEIGLRDLISFQFF